MRIKGKLIFEGDSDKTVLFDFEFGLDEPSVKEQIRFFKEEFDRTPEEAISEYMIGVGYAPEIVIEEYEFYEEEKV